MLRCRFALAILSFLAASLSPASARDSVITVPSRPGVTQKFILMEPDGPPEVVPRAIIVAWPSGDGILGLTETGIGYRDAFFPRAASRFTAAGLALALADVPSDHPTGLAYEFRVTPEHVADVAAVVAAVRARISRPIFVAGFSRGTLSAANAAARLESGAVAGVILASSVMVQTGLARRTLHDLPLADIRVPVLAIHHRDDDCAITPPGRIPELLQALVAAPRRDVRLLTEGSRAGGGCFAHTPHDFYEAEDQAVTATTAWIDSVLGSR